MRVKQMTWRADLVLGLRGLSERRRNRRGTVVAAG